MSLLGSLITAAPTSRVLPRHILRSFIHLKRRIQGFLGETETAFFGGWFPSKMESHKGPMGRLYIYLHLFSVFCLGSLKIPSKKMPFYWCEHFWMEWSSIGTTPTQDGSHHKDYEPFLGSGIPINLHLWLASWVGCRRKWSRFWPFFWTVCERGFPTKLLNVCELRC